MKKIYLLLTLCMLFIFSAAAVAAEKIEPPKPCRQCGMDRVAFSYSRMMIKYADGTSAGVCSLNCAAVEMKANRGKKVKALQVADFYSKRLIDAKSATWVMGGSMQGVMTSMPKWAFARRDDAQRFIRENGGRMTTFTEVLDQALRENEQG